MEYGETNALGCKSKKKKNKKIASEFKNILLQTKKKIIFY